jgi:cytoskeletal protein CcmA (bactofilin family)
MSFLNNNSRLTPKGPSNDKSERESGFGSDLLHSAPEQSDAVSTRPPAGSYADRVPSFAAPPASGPTPADKCTNVVSAGAKWNGTLTVDDSLRIDGVFSGEVESKGTVHVAEGAQVDAKVRAQYVVVSGEFRGEIRCEQRTDLMPRSRVSGEVYTKVLSVHEGATLDGSVKMSGALDADGRRAGGRFSRSAESETAASERRADRVGAAANGRSQDDDA